MRTALSDAGLGAGAICMRYPKAFRLGAFTNPDPQLRREAVELTLEAAQWARDLGADELVMWSAYDGYDYALQVDYRQVQTARPQTPVSKWRGGARVVVLLGAGCGVSWSVLGCCEVLCSGVDCRGVVWNDGEGCPPPAPAPIVQATPMSKQD